MRTRFSRATGVFAVGAVLALSACSGSSGGSGGNSSLPQDPQAELAASVQNLSQSDTLTATFKLDLTADQLKQIGTATKQPLSDDEANAISSAQVVVTSDKGKDATDFAVQDGGTTLVDIRAVSGTLYLQANVNAIATQFHQQQQVSALQAETAQMPTFVQALLQGKWISIDKNTLSTLQNQIVPGTSGQSSSPPNLQLFDQFKTLLTQDVTAKKIGTDSNGDHLQLTANTRQVATDLQSAVANAVPGGSALGSQFGNPRDVPSRDVVIDAWVSGGALSKVSLDLAQFDDKHKLPAGTQLPLSLTLSQTASDISAPSGAVAVDLSQLSGLLGAFGAGSGGGFPGG